MYSTRRNLLLFHTSTTIHPIFQNVHLEKDVIYTLFRSECPLLLLSCSELVDKFSTAWSVFWSFFNVTIFKEMILPIFVFSYTSELSFLINIIRAKTPPIVLKYDPEIAAFFFSSFYILIASNRFATIVEQALSKWLSLLF